MDPIRAWLHRFLSDPQAIVLALSLLAGLALLLLVGDMLKPAIGSVVIAYLLEGLVRTLERWHVPRLLAICVVISGFVLALLFALLAVIPLLVRQITQLSQQLPGMIETARAFIDTLPERYPNLLTEVQVQALVGEAEAEVNQLRNVLLARTLSFGIGMITAVVYIVLVPVLVFFMLKDKHKILHWFNHYLPHNRGLALKVWHEVDVQVANYVRGKFWEIIIVWSATFVTFALLGLDYALLLSALVGFSVLVPYLGAIVVTVPVAAVALFQWGWSIELFYAVGAYAIIQFIDGNLLVPLIFSEVVDLHPIAILLAIMFFGGIWGFWGVFFAIPLATLVQAVLRAWPRRAPPAQPADGEVSWRGGDR